MEGKVGPYNEGGTLVLTCDILGGIILILIQFLKHQGRHGKSFNPSAVTFC